MTNSTILDLNLTKFQNIQEKGVEFRFRNHSINIEARWSANRNPGQRRKIDNFGYKMYQKVASHKR